MTRSKGAPKNWRNLRYPKGQPVARSWPDRTPLERILAKLEERDGCLVFTGRLSRHGYGRLNVDGRVHFTHRLMYEVFVGPIQDGLTLDHLCRNRSCCNPAHLEAVTLEENKRRGESFAAVNARKTHCTHGHRYDEANTYITAEGYRQCRACIRARTKQAAAEKFASRPRRECSLAECDRLLPVAAPLHARYCSSRCRRRQAHLLFRERHAA